MTESAEVAPFSWLYQQRPLVTPSEPLTGRSRTRIVQSQALHEAIVAVVLCLPRHASVRMQLACDAAVLSIEHQGAAALLLSNGHAAAAHTLIRPSSESCARALWLAYLATDSQVAELIRNKSSLDLGKMCRKLQKSRHEVLRQIGTNLLTANDPFSSFAHLGKLQLTRKATGFGAHEVENAAFLHDFFAGVSAALLAQAYDHNDLQNLVHRTAVAIAWESHYVSGSAPPGENDTGALPRIPAWREPDWDTFPFEDSRP